MLIYPFAAPRQTVFGELLRDMNRIQRQMHALDLPVAGGLGLQDFANSSNEITNDKDKFAINLNVHQFKPEELKIDLEGRRLTIEGVQEHKSDGGFSKRSFSRVILLPEDVDLSAVASNLTADGHLSIEAPKKEVVKGRNIPIQQNPTPTPAVTEKPHPK